MTVPSTHIHRNQLHEGWLFGQAAFTGTACPTVETSPAVGSMLAGGRRFGLTVLARAGAVTTALGSIRVRPARTTELCCPPAACC